MGWRWHSPPPDKRTPGKVSPWSCATREEAQAKAIETALGRAVSDACELDPLWRSLERAGWEVRLEL